MVNFQKSGTKIQFRTTFFNILFSSQNSLMNNSLNLFGLFNCFIHTEIPREYFID